MSAFDDALGISTEETTEETEETKPDEKPDEKKPPLRMHAYKDEFKDFAAEQKRLSGGT